jgi:hypothetical protein
VVKIQKCVQLHIFEFQKPMQLSDFEIQAALRSGVDPDRDVDRVDDTSNRSAG